jgi:hypothetical protein
MSSIVDALQNSGLAIAIRNSLYDFPLLEATHVIALTLVFGTIMIVDLRLLGVAGTERRYDRVSADILKWTWIAFGIAALTGSLMFVSNAKVYVNNNFFRAKIAVMLLAGLNMLVFELTVAKQSGEWAENRRGPLRGRIAAALSLGLWLCVIVLGRAVGFTTTGQAAKLSQPAPNVDFNSFLDSSSAPASAPPSSSAQP